MRRVWHEGQAGTERHPQTAKMVLNWLYQDHKTFTVCGTKPASGGGGRVNGLFLSGPWESGNP